MRRATITLPDPLDEAVERFRREQPAPPSLTAVVHAALEHYLDGRESERPRGDVLARVVRHRSDIRRLVAAHGGSHPRLFGSLARGEQHAESDVDLLVDLEAGRTLFDVAAMSADLEALLGVVVDVVPAAGMDADSRAAVFEDALPL